MMNICCFLTLAQNVLALVFSGLRVSEKGVRSKAQTQQGQQLCEYCSFTPGGGEYGLRNIVQ